MLNKSLGLTKGERLVTNLFLQGWNRMWDLNSHCVVAGHIDHTELFAFAFIQLHLCPIHTLRAPRGQEQGRQGLFIYFHIAQFKAQGKLTNCGCAFICCCLMSQNCYNNHVSSVIRDNIFTSCGCTVYNNYLMDILCCLHSFFPSKNNFILYLDTSLQDWEGLHV